MSTGGARDEGHEVLAQGGEEPPRRGRRLLLAVAAVVLVAGYAAVAHDWSDDPRGALSSGTAGEADDAPVVEAVPLPPEEAELAGVWFVPNAPAGFEPGQLWMAFHTDGSFVLDPGGGLLSPDPWARGRYLLEGARLTLWVEDGAGCRAGDRLEWAVGILGNGNLHATHESDNGGRCRAIPGDWRARPLQDRDMSRVSWRE